MITTQYESGAKPVLKSRRHRSWRWGAYLLAAGLVGWYAYAHWNMQPAALARGAKGVARPVDWRGSADGAGDDGLSELDEAIRAVPMFAPQQAVPRKQSGNNPAMAFRIGDPGGLADALTGEWDPERRPHLKQVVAWLSQPSINNLLDGLVRVAAKQPRRMREVDEDPFGFRPGPTSNVQYAALALAARSRFKQTARGDVAGAAADLKAALRVAADSVDYWSNPLATVQTELSFFAREHALPREIAGDLIACLRDELGVSMGQLMLARNGLAGTVQEILDRYYTDDGDGNGRLVLSAMRTGYAGMAPLGEGGPRSRIWNLFSPLFNDRTTVAAKVARVEDEIRRLDEMGYAAAMDYVTRLETQRVFTATDGPFVNIGGAGRSWMLQQAAQQVTARKALIVMLALSNYRHDHGRYPEKLEALIPDYLPEVPVELMTGQPYAYEAEPLDPQSGAADRPSYRLGVASDVPIDPRSMLGALGYIGQNQALNRANRDILFTPARPDSEYEAAGAAESGSGGAGGEPTSAPATQPDAPEAELPGGPEADESGG